MQKILLKQGGWSVSLPFVSKEKTVQEMEEIHNVYQAVANKSKLPFLKLKPFFYQIIGGSQHNPKIMDEGELYLRKGEFISAIPTA